MAVDKERAMQLRLDGKSLQGVADEMECSLAWCKANLKGIKQPNKDKGLIEEVRLQGRSARGVTTGEIKMLTNKHYPNLIGDDLEDKVDNIRKAARRGNKDVIIRPYWMLPECPRDCTLSLLEYAQEVWSFKQYLADKYRKEYDLDDTYNKTVVYALTMMSAGENSRLMPQGLLNYGASLERIQDALDIRNNPQYQLPCTQTDEVHEYLDFEYTDMDYIPLMTGYESI